MRRAVLISTLTLFFCAIIGWHIYGRLDLNPTHWAIQATDNATDMPFVVYALIVDERGNPLEGVKCDYTIQRFNHTWVASGGSSHRGDDLFDKAVSDADGKIVISGSGHGLVLENFKLQGYERLFDKIGDDTIPTQCAGPRASVILSSHGQRLYVSDPDHPAVFIMVRDGAKIATTMPCMGGTFPPQKIGGPRMENVPVWPHRPSITDLHYER